MSVQNQVKPYRYFDTPDGYDVYKKLMCAMKPTILTASTIAFSEVMFLSKPKGYLPIFSRFVYISSPILASSLSFVLVTNSLASIRNKDDKLNWFCGGFSVGAIFGTFGRSGMLGFNLGMAFGAMAFLRKMAIENNFELFPDFKLYHSGPLVNDYSLSRDIPGNWKK